MSEMDLAGLDKIIDQHGRWGKLTFADLYDTFLYDTLDTLTACVDELEAENKRLEESLRAFAKGLECKEIDDLMTREPEAFELLGKTMTSMVVDLITENKRLREALNTIHKRIMGYEPDNRIEARFFGELKIIARKALDNKAE